MSMKKTERETTQERANFCSVVFFCVGVQLQQERKEIKENE
jgi:hypothetical protein